MTSKEIILEIKKQIWDNAYHVKEHHWTQIYSNLDLLSKDLEMLEIFIDGFNHMTSFGEILISDEDEIKIRRWLDERKS